MSTPTSTSTALWIAYANGDATARDTLARQHLDLVHHVVNRLTRYMAEADVDELLSAGRMGLVSALESFDHTRGLAFSTYAVPRIQGAILDELRRLDVLSRGVRRKARDIAQARHAVGARLGRAPRSTEVAAQLGVEADVLWRWEAAVDTAVPVALDAATAREDGEGAPREGWEMLACAQEELPGARLEQEETVAELRAALAQLSDQERMVLSLYYFEELKLHEIGRVLGVSDSRISQIRTKALLRLREIMQGVEA